MGKSSAKAKESCAKCDAVPSTGGNARGKGVPALRTPDSFDEVVKTIIPGSVVAAASNASPTNVGGGLGSKKSKKTVTWDTYNLKGGALKMLSPKHVGGGDIYEALYTAKYPKKVEEFTHNIKSGGGSGSGSGGFFAKDKHAVETIEKWKAATGGTRYVIPRATGTNLTSASSKDPVKKIGGGGKHGHGHGHEHPPHPFTPMTPEQHGGLEKALRMNITVKGGAGFKGMKGGTAKNRTNVTIGVAKKVVVPKNGGDAKVKLVWRGGAPGDGPAPKRQRINGPDVAALEAAEALLSLSEKDLNGEEVNKVNDLISKISDLTSTQIVDLAIKHTGLELLMLIKERCTPIEERMFQHSMNFIQNAELFDEIIKKKTEPSIRCNNDSQDSCCAQPYGDDTQEEQNQTINEVELIEAHNNAVDALIAQEENTYITQQEASKISAHLKDNTYTEWVKATIRPKLEGHQKHAQEQTAAQYEQLALREAIVTGQSYIDPNKYKEIATSLRAQNDIEQTMKYKLIRVLDLQMMNTKRFILNKLMQARTIIMNAPQSVQAGIQRTVNIRRGDSTTATPPTALPTDEMKTTIAAVISNVKTLNEDNHRETINHIQAIQEQMRNLTEQLKNKTEAAATAPPPAQPAQPAQPAPAGGKRLVTIKKSGGARRPKSAPATAKSVGGSGSVRRASSSRKTAVTVVKHA